MSTLGGHRIGIIYMYLPPQLSSAILGHRLEFYNPMDPFNITIPTLPAFALPTVPSTPRNDPKKRQTLEERCSPAKRIRENIQRDSSFKMPLVPLEYPGRSPLSPSKRINISTPHIHPTPPPTPLHIPMPPPAPTP